MASLEASSNQTKKVEGTRGKSGNDGDDAAVQRMIRDS